MIEPAVELSAYSQQARRLILKAIYHAGSGHPGGALSAVELLLALYFQQLRFNEQQPNDPQRDRFVLSKGHGVAALYSVLALRGLLPARELATFRRLNSRLQGHPYSASLDWVDGTSGSLGQGYSAALGIAKGFQLQAVNANSYVLIGDGELQEGMIWEGALFAAQHRLANACVILDYNRLQSDALVSEIAAIEPLQDKWRAFGWQVVACDGHDFSSIKTAFRAFEKETEKPTIIIASTVKGKGISFMENQPSWHGALTLSGQDYVAALNELGVEEAEMPDYLNAGWWGVAV